jgi:hypothetical protein
VEAPGRRRRHLPLARRVDLLDTPTNATSPPSIPFLFLLSLTLSPGHTCRHPSSVPWPSPSAITRRLPDLLRTRPQFRLVSLLLLAKGIEPPWTESPPPSPFLAGKPSTATSEFAADRPPPAEPTPPSASW